MVYRNKTFANNVVVGLSSGKVELSADSGDLLIKSGGSTTTVRPGLGITSQRAVTIVENKAALPLPPTGIDNGSLYFASATNELFMKSGGGWYRITLVNTSPSITLNKTTATIASNNLTLDVNYTTVEPEGTPITISVANSGIATTDVATVTHTTSNNNIRVVFDGETELSGATVTATVTDGVNTGVGTITITTAYYDGLKSNLDSFVLKADPNSGAVTNAQKSIALNGSSEHLTIPLTTLALGTGDFTIESWVYLRSRATNHNVVWSNYSTYTTGGIALFAGHPNHTTSYTIAHGGLTFPSVNGGTLNYNRWDHLAVVRNSGTITMYQNGISIGSFSSTTNLAGNGSNFFIGNGGDVVSTGYNHADYSNFRIVIGTAVYTGNFTPPTDVLTKTGGTYPSTTNINTSITASHTKLLTAQGSTTDNSDDGLTVTSVGTPDVSGNSPYHGGNNDIYDDASTSNHTLTKNGSVQQLSFSPYYEPGYSVKLDSGDEVTFPDSNNYHIGTNQFSVEGWVFPTAFGSYLNGLLGHFSSASRGWGFGYNSTSIKFYGSSNGGSSTNESHEASVRIPTNKWTHIVATRDASRIRLFKDGLLVYNATNTSNFNNSSQPLRIGDANPSVNQQAIGYLKDIRFVNGSIPTEYQTTSTETNVKIFDVPTSSPTAITNTQLLTFHSNRVFDGSTNNATPTFVNTPKISPFSPYERVFAYSPSDHGGSFYLANGDADYITIPASSDLQILGGAFTFEAWVYPTSIQTQNHIFSKGRAPSPNQREYAFRFKSNDIGMYWSTTGSSGSGPDQTVTASTTINRYEWFHFAMTMDSSNNVTLYKNGVSVGTDTFNGTYNTSLNHISRIGRFMDYTGVSHDFHGYISDMRIVKGSVVYTGNFTPPTAPLTAITNTTLLLNANNAKIFDASQVLEKLTPNGVVASSGQQHFSENTLYFDGTDDYINLSDSERFNLRSAGDDKDFTIESWIYKTNTSKDTWICQRNNSTTELSILLDANASGYVAGSVDVEYDSGQFIFDAGITRNAWQHIAFVRSGNRVNWYTDGVLKDTRTEPASLVDYSADFQIGRFGSNQHYYHGYMHDFRFTKDTSRYPYIAKPVTLTTTNSGMTKPDGSTPTVTASNVTLLTCHTGTAGSQTITDGSTNNTTITVNGNASVSDFGPAPGMKSVYFDGTGDYLQCTLADTLGTNDWTLEFWVYLRAITGNHIFCAFNGYAPAFYRRSGSSALAVYHNGGISSPYYNASADATANKWFHMAYCHDTSENVMNVFRDGSLLDTFTYTGNINGTTFRIGDDGTSAWHNGYISNLRIVKDTVLYPNSFTPKATALK